VRLENHSLLATSLPSDVLTLIIRNDRLPCRESDWDVRGENGTIYTIFKGDRFKHLIGFCDELMSTNVEQMVSIVGKSRALLMYKQHIVGDNVDPFLANMFCTLTKGCKSYNSIATDMPIKRISIREQIGTLTDSALNNRMDDVKSFESRFMLGLSLH